MIAFGICTHPQIGGNIFCQLNENKRKTNTHTNDTKFKRRNGLCVSYEHISCVFSAYSSFMRSFDKLEFNIYYLFLTYTHDHSHTDETAHMKDMVGFFFVVCLDFSWFWRGYWMRREPVDQIYQRFFDFIGIFLLFFLSIKSVSASQFANNYTIVGMDIM